MVIASIEVFLFVHIVAVYFRPVVLQKVTPRDFANLHLVTVRHNTA